VEIASAQLSESSTEVSEIVFFLLGAMTIVEIVDAHQGFKIVTDSITTRKPRLLLWVVGWTSHSLPLGLSFLLLQTCIGSLRDILCRAIIFVGMIRDLTSSDILEDNQQNKTRNGEIRVII
jgi:hypothetical protein